MHHHDPDRAHDGRRRDGDLVRCRREPVGRARRHVVDDRHDGFLIAGRADLLRQPEHPGRLAAGRVDVERDRPDLRVRDGVLERRLDPLVGGQPRVAPHPGAAIDQRPVDVDERHPVGCAGQRIGATLAVPRPGEPAGIWGGCRFGERRLGFLGEFEPGGEPTQDDGSDHLGLRGRDEQRRVERPVEDVREAHQNTPPARMPNRRGRPPDADRHCASSRAISFLSSARFASV